jgi:hypothetical protein
VTTFERIRQELLEWSDPSGLSTSVLLQLNEPLRSTLKRIMREGSRTFSELSTDLGLDMDETETIADLLVECGFLKTSEEDATGECIYRIRHTKSHRPEAPVALWDLILGDTAAPDGTAAPDDAEG